MYGVWVTSRRYTRRNPFRFRYFVAVPGNWLRRSRGKKVDIKEMNFQRGFTDRQSLLWNFTFSFAVMETDWTRSVILLVSSCSRSYLSYLVSFLWIQKFLLYFPSSTLGQLTSRHEILDNWAVTCLPYPGTQPAPIHSLPHSCNLWKVLGELKCHYFCNV